jgi:hypothetical protein
MAHFVVITGKHGYEYINLDTVRHITDDSDGKITLRFDLTHRITLEHDNSRHVIDEIKKAVA